LVGFVRLAQRFPEIVAETGKKGEWRDFLSQ
jgi:hypothetical protein